MTQSGAFLVEAIPGSQDSKPKAVRQAVLLLWVSWLIIAVDGIAMVLPYDSGEWLLQVATAAVIFTLSLITAVLIVFAERRRNWARLLLLPWILAGIGMSAVSLTEPESVDWAYWIAPVSSVPLEAIALVLLFSRESSRWYAPSAHAEWAAFSLSPGAPLVAFGAAVHAVLVAIWFAPLFDLNWHSSVGAWVALAWSWLLWPTLMALRRRLRSKPGFIAVAGGAALIAATSWPEAYVLARVFLPAL